MELKILLAYGLQTGHPDGATYHEGYIGVDYIQSQCKINPRGCILTY